MSMAINDLSVQSTDGLATSGYSGIDIKDHGEVYIVCKQLVCSEWRDLGARLGVLQNTLDTIEADYILKGGVKRCMSEMLSVWLRRPQGEVTDKVKPTWNALCQALSFFDKVLAERTAVEHGFNISRTVFEVCSQNGISPTFLPQSCGCSRCTIQEWKDGIMCKKVRNLNFRPKVIVVNPDNPSVREITEFSKDFARQMDLYYDTCKVVANFATVSIKTWKCLYACETHHSEMILAFGAWFLRPLPIVSSIQELQNCIHSLRVSWFNFSPLHFLAKEFLFSLYPDVRTSWNQYCAVFKLYCSRRHLKDYSSVFFQLEDQNIFLLEVDDSYDDFTLADIENFRKSLSIALDVPAVSLHLVTVRQKCLIIYFYYCFTDYLIKFGSLSPRQLKKIAMFEPHKILSLTDLHDQFKYSNIQKYYHYEDSSDIDQSINDKELISSLTTEVQLWKKQAQAKDIHLSQKDAEIGLLNDQLKKNEDKYDLEKQKQIATETAEMMELEEVTINEETEITSMELEEVVPKKEDVSSTIKNIEKKYRSIENVWFEGQNIGSRFMQTKPRYIIEVCSSEVASVLKEINGLDVADKVWKGITVGTHFGTDVQLWAESVSGTSGRYRITSIELVTGLNWQKHYEALFNVRLEREDSS